MSYTITTESPRFANLTVHAGPSPLGAWLRTALQRLMSRPAEVSVPRDRAREAAEVRTWAESVRRHDPRFAADLFAAADRHESTAG